MSDYNISSLVNHEEIKLPRQINTRAPIYKYYKKEEQEIEKFCAENFISCFLDDRVLVVQTPISLWKIITNGHKHYMFLYHRNDPRTDYEDQSQALVPYYHSQSCRRNTIIEYLKYIVAHDDFREHNPARRPHVRRNKPHKGTRRYKKQVQKSKRINRQKQIRKVEKLLKDLNNDKSELY